MQAERIWKQCNYAIRHRQIALSACKATRLYFQRTMSELNSHVHFPFDFQPNGTKNQHSHCFSVKYHVVRGCSFAEPLRENCILQDL